jgi:hypothetical protein
MISSLWPLTVKVEIKRVSNDFVPLRPAGLRAGGKGNKKQINSMEKNNKPLGLARQ